MKQLLSINEVVLISQLVIKLSIETKSRTRYCKFDSNQETEARDTKRFKKSRNNGKFPFNFPLRLDAKPPEDRKRNVMVLITTKVSNFKSKTGTEMAREKTKRRKKVNLVAQCVKKPCHHCRSLQCRLRCRRLNPP